MKLYFFFFLVFLFWGCQSDTFVEKARSHPSIAINEVNVSPTTKPESSLRLNEDEVIHWQSTVQNILLEWDGKDLYFRERSREKQGVFSLLARNLNRSLSSTADLKGCDDTHHFRLLSVVGTVISFEHENGFICGTTSEKWRYTSIDLNKPGDIMYLNSSEAQNEKRFIQPSSSKLISLKELFPEDDILSGLLANQLISQEIINAINDKRIITTPQNLSEFGKFFTKFDYSKFGGDFYLEKDFLTRFAFKDIRENKVSICISLTPTTHANSANHEYIEIYLPIPQKLQKFLELAASEKEGFLIKDARDKVGNKFASFKFREGLFIKSGK